MVVTVIQIKRLIETGTKLKAIASITLDNLVVIHDIKVLDDGNSLFLAMPSKAVKAAGFKDIIVHPINTETRQAFERLIFSAYNASIKEGKVYIDVKMKYDEIDNIFTQSSEEYEVVSFNDEFRNAHPQEPKYIAKKSNSFSQEKPKTNSFIKWLKS